MNQKSEQLEVHVLTPTGADASVVQDVLQRIGIPIRICKTMDDVCASIDEAGLLLIAEEALSDDGRRVLFNALEAQPEWSDIPVIVLTTEGELSRSLPQEVAELTYHSNLTLLERPVRVATLTTILNSGLRARRRQLDLRDMIENVRAAREEADRANAAKSHFLTTMSHELRTPLNAIAGYTEILQMEIAGPINEQQRQHLERISKSERHLLTLIDDVLDFAKLEAGHQSFEFSEFTLSKLVDDLEAFIEPQIVGKGIRYSAVIEQRLTVYADEEKTRQILLNLLSNAIKFTREDGSIQLSATDGDGQVKISVTDNGSGIAPDKLHSVFEPFVQVGRSLNTPGMGGTGLGLPISRDLARAMNGDVTVTSVYGEGSTFTLILPAAKA